MEWRKAWADVTNRYLERYGHDERIDHRSHADRGLTEQPTIHEGVVARALEKKGVISDRCEINRQIKADKKIRAVFKAKGESGKPLCTNPPYGYIKDPDDKHHWIVDEVAADVVRDIFKMCVAGKGPSQIAKALSQRQIPVPTVHLHRMGINTPAREPEDIYAWQQRTAADILVKMKYLGHTVNFKTKKKSYKSKKKVNNDPSEWVIFENTHEAIIGQETFEIVLNIRNGRRRLTPMGEMPVLSGMLFCADCGAKLYQVRARG